MAENNADESARWRPITEDSSAPDSAATVICPFCHSYDVEPLAMFGAQLLTDQRYCRACHTPFEHVRDISSSDVNAK